MTLTKSNLTEIIEDVIKGDKSLSKRVDLYAFKELYFNKIMKRLKNDNGGYTFSHDKYQESINLYFYYTQEKNIYHILALALIERKLFDKEG